MFELKSWSIRKWCNLKCLKYGWKIEDDYNRVAVKAFQEYKESIYVLFKEK